MGRGIFGPFPPQGRRPFVDCLYTIEEAITPAHEGLGVDVLVVLDKVQTAAQSFVNDATVIAGGEAQFWLCRRAEQGTPVLIKILTLHYDAMCRSLEGLDVMWWNTHIL